MDENEKLISKSNLGIVLDAMKTKFDEVPDSLADLSQDSTHRTVTDAEKEEWNGKYRKPSGGIPSTDLQQNLQDKINQKHIIDGYYNSSDGKFYADSSYSQEISGDSNKLYISIDTNTIYRWELNQFILIESQPEIFWCEYGTTTFTEILEAYNAGKRILCIYKEGRRVTVIMSLTYEYNGREFHFSCVFGGGLEVYSTSIDYIDGWNEIYTDQIPLYLSDLEEDEEHRTVTDVEKSKWNSIQTRLIDDVKQNGTSIVSNKIANIVLETSLGLDSNNAATATAVRSFVNSSINSLAAFYITSNEEGDAFENRFLLAAGPWYYAGALRAPTQNDYAIVTADDTHDGKTARYLYTGTRWSFQYTFDVTFTQAQLDAMNSGITSALRQTYDTHLADTDTHVTASDKSRWNSKTEPIPSWPTKPWSIVSQNPLTISIDGDDLLTWQDARYDIYVFEVLESIDPSLLDVGFLGCNIAFVDGAYYIKASRHAIITNDDGTFIIVGEEDDDENIVFSLIRVPDKLSDLSGDNLHRLVTDAEKATWNAKQEALPSGQIGDGLVWDGTSWVKTNTVRKEIITDETVDCSSDNNKAWIGKLSGPLLLLDGDMYDIEINDDTYENLVCYTDLIPYIGDMMLTELPFCSFSLNPGAIFLKKETYASGNYNIKIMHHIPNKISIINTDSNAQNGTEKYSTKEGYNTEASGESAHAEGGHTTASGTSSHAEGVWSVASGARSHAEGWQTTAAGDNSHAEGVGTYAGSNRQHVQGESNVVDNNNVYADIVGAGTSSAKKNIEATTWTGDKRLKGDVYVHCNDDSTGGDKLATLNDIPVIPETDEVDEIAIDDVPTTNSTNLVTSGGVKSALDGKENKSPEIVLEISQIISQDPLIFELTQAQYNIAADTDYSNVFIDASSIGLGTIAAPKSIANGYISGSAIIPFGGVGGPSDNRMYSYFINPEYYLYVWYQSFSDINSDVVTESHLTAALSEKQDISPTITVDASQIISMDPVRVELTEAQFDIFSNVLIPSIVVLVPAMELEITFNAYQDWQRTTILTTAGGLTAWTLRHLSHFADYEVELVIDYCAYTVYEDGRLVKFSQDELHSAVPGADYVAPPSIVTSGTAITLADNTEYKLSGVTTLDITFPASGAYSCWMTITTDATTAPTITFPASALFVGTKPSFGVGETWKIFIEDGVIVAGKAVST